MDVSTKRAIICVRLDRAREDNDAERFLDRIERYLRQERAIDAP